MGRLEVPAAGQAPAGGERMKSINADSANEIYES